MESAATPAPGLGALSRLGTSFTAPVRTFQAVALRPSFVAVLVALCLSTLGAQLLLTPKLDVESGVRKQLVQRGAKMSDEQVDQAVAMAGKLRWIGPIAGVVFQPLVVAAAAALFLVALKLLGSEAGYPAVFSAVLHAFWPPTLVRSVLLAAATLGRPTVALTEADQLVRSSVASWTSLEPGPWRALLTSVDVITFWQLGLLVLGLATVGRVSWKRISWVVLGLWLTMVGLITALAALQTVAAS